VIRPYSISDYPESCDYYRISIKRELAPKGSDAPSGVASNFMHDHIQTGAAIAIKPPSGQFVLDIQKSLPVVLISNGIGITPFLSIAKACSRLNSKRTIWFVHGARNGQTHAFRDEVLEIAEQNPNLHVHFRYSHPQPEDQGDYDSIGHVDTELVKTLVEQDAEFYLCGSPPFLESLQTGLKEWGVPKERVFHESFDQRSKALSNQSSGEAVGKEVEQSEIVLAQSGKTVTWHDDDGTILELAEANGLHPPYSCRQGICGTCMCKIREGSVAYQIPPTAEIDEDSVLICISKPASSKVILDV